MQGRVRLLCIAGYIHYNSGRYMDHVNSKRSVLPDPLQVAKYANNPGKGPSILFFSGGSALQPLCRHLIRFTHNSIHIITPFDSGGSSANLRKAFNMPAIGDIRNRLIALTDQGSHGNREICALFSHRMPVNVPEKTLRTTIEHMASGKHPLVSGLPRTIGDVIKDHIRDFIDRMPPSFDLSGASIGNLVLASGYLSHNRQLDPVIASFSKLASVRGIVQPVVNKNLHLAASLENGATVIGQHMITGKENKPIDSPVKQIFLCESQTNPLPVEIGIRKDMRALIETADLVVYPMGSFYSSIISNLMPRGTGNEISRLSCPKIYIPNTSLDPESLGHDVADQVEVLLSFLKKDNPGKISTPQILHYVLVDRQNGAYSNPIDVNRIKKMGVGIIDYPLVTRRTAPLVDETQLAPLLLSLAESKRFVDSGIYRSKTPEIRVPLA
jgi:CofD-related protein of GAK system